MTRGIIAIAAVASMGLTGLALPASAGQSGFSFFGQSIPSQTATVYSAGDLANNRSSSIAFDSAGDMFVGNRYGAIDVVASTDTTLFGQRLTKNTPVEFKPGGSNAFTATYTPMLAFDKKGNLYIADEGSNTLDVYVVSVKDGSIFGQSVTKNTPVLLHPTGDPGINLQALGQYPNQVAFDKKGNLYIASYSAGSMTNSGSVVVVPKKTAKIFGQSVAKNTPAVLAGSNVDGVEALAFDKKGNLFMGNYSTSEVKVLAKKSGSIFGVAVQKNAWSTVATAQSGYLNWFRFDKKGNLFMGNWSRGQDMEVLAKKTATVFGQSVTKNVLSNFASSTVTPLISSTQSFDFSPGGALVVASWNGAPVVLAP